MVNSLRLSLYTVIWVKACVGPDTSVVHFRCYENRHELHIKCYRVFMLSVNYLWTPSTWLIECCETCFRKYNVRIKYNGSEVHDRTHQSSYEVIVHTVFTLKQPTCGACGCFIQSHSTTVWMVLPLHDFYFESWVRCWDLPKTPAGGKYSANSLSVVRSVTKYWKQLPTNKHVCNCRLTDNPSLSASLRARSTSNWQGDFLSENHE